MIRLGRGGETTILKKNKTTPPQAVRAEKFSLSKRLFLIASLILILLIPTFLLRFLIEERRSRRDAVVTEVAQQWSGGAQNVVGPILTIPYKKYYKDESGRIRLTIHHAHFLPQRLSVVGKIKPEIRYRGIYRVGLYFTEMHFLGSFSPLDFKGLDVAPQEVLWPEAFLSIGVSNVKGIDQPVQLSWDHQAYVAEPGIKNKDVVPAGFTVNIEIPSRPTQHTFAFDLNLKGHDTLQLAPIGNTTTVKLTSPWPHPSFVGAYLPQNRVVNKNGFYADWKVFDLNRNFPQRWTDDAHNVEPWLFGVRLYFPVDYYQQVTRAWKYALMFIFLTFLAFFMLEVVYLTPRRSTMLHPLHYLLIGSGLVLFYSLLLSLSEYIGFGAAYTLASASIIGLITAYSKAVLSDIRATAIVGSILILLYGCLYVILRLEDYALFMGSMVLFMVLAGVMYLTRHFDWFNLPAGKKSV